MAMTRIAAMLESCAGESPPFPPTLLYNEGWMLRLVMDWFLGNEVTEHRLAFLKDSRWYSEALLPSAFLARHKGDPLAESWTHADGAIGHFTIGEEGKTDLSLLPDAEQLVVLEAKMFSKLATGVAKAKYYDQAARNVACIAEVLRRADREPSRLSRLGFYVLAPQSKIDDGVFALEVDCGSIREKVGQRATEYGGEKDQWRREWFEPTVDRIDIGQIAWEDVIQVIRQHDPSSAGWFEKFYTRCLFFGQ